MVLVTQTHVRETREHTELINNKYLVWWSSLQELVDGPGYTDTREIDERTHRTDKQ